MAGDTVVDRHRVQEHAFASMDIERIGAIASVDVLTALSACRFFDDVELREEDLRWGMRRHGVVQGDGVTLSQFKGIAEALYAKKVVPRLRRRASLEDNFEAWQASRTPARSAQPAPQKPCVEPIVAAVFEEHDPQQEGQVEATGLERMVAAAGIENATTDMIAYALSKIGKTLIDMVNVYEFRAVCELLSPEWVADRQAEKLAPTPAKETSPPRTASPRGFPFGPADASTGNAGAGVRYLKNRQPYRPIDLPAPCTQNKVLQQGVEAVEVCPRSHPEGDAPPAFPSPKSNQDDDGPHEHPAPMAPAGEMSVPMLAVVAATPLVDHPVSTSPFAAAVSDEDALLQPEEEGLAPSRVQSILKSPGQLRTSAQHTPRDVHIELPTMALTEATTEPPPALPGAQSVITCQRTCSVLEPAVSFDTEPPPGLSRVGTAMTFGTGLGCAQSMQSIPFSQSGSGAVAPLDLTGVAHPSGLLGATTTSVPTGALQPDASLLAMMPGVEASETATGTTSARQTASVGQTPREVEAEPAGRGASPPGAHSLAAVIEASQKDLARAAEAKAKKAEEEAAKNKIPLSSLRKVRVLSNPQRLRELIDGHPALAGWNEVYASHVGADAVVLREVPTRRAVGVRFADGKVAWYPRACILTEEQAEEPPPSHPLIHDGGRPSDVPQAAPVPAPIDAATAEVLAALGGRTAQSIAGLTPSGATDALPDPVDQPPPAMLDISTAQLAVSRRESSASPWSVLQPVPHHLQHGQCHNVISAGLPPPSQYELARSAHPEVSGYHSPATAARNRVRQAEGDVLAPPMRARSTGAPQHHVHHHADEDREESLPGERRGSPRKYHPPALPEYCPMRVLKYDVSELDAIYPMAAKAAAVSPEEIGEVYAMFDVKQAQQIPRATLHLMLRALGYCVPQVEVSGHLKRLGLAASAAMDEKEFAAHVARIAKHHQRVAKRADVPHVARAQTLTRDALEQLFHLFDEPGAGTLPRGTLTVCLNAVGLQDSHEVDVFLEVDALLAHPNIARGERRIGLDAFVRLVQQLRSGGAAVPARREVEPELP